MSSLAGRRESRRFATLFGLSAATGMVIFHANRFGERFLHLTPLQSRDLFWWPMLVAILLYVRLVEGRPMSSIGFRRLNWLTPVVGVGLALVATYPIGWISDAIVSALHLSSAASSPAAAAINHTPYWYRVLLVTRAAFVEEVLFRPLASPWRSLRTRTSPIGGGHR